MSHRARSITLSITAAVLVVAAGGVAYWHGHKKAYQAPAAPYTASTAATASTKEVPTTDVNYQGEDGKTALELLKKHAKVQTKTSSMGEFVTSINGNDGGGKKYWTFYLNGQMAQEGAGAYVSKSTDKIEWRLQ